MGTTPPQLTEFGPQNPVPKSNDTIRLKGQPLVWKSGQAVLFRDTNEALRWMEDATRIESFLDGNDGGKINQINEALLRKLQNSSSGTLQYKARYLPFVEMALRDMAPQLVQKVHVDSLDFTKYLQTLSGLLVGKTAETTALGILSDIQSRLEKFLLTIQKSGKSPAVCSRIDNLIKSELFPIFQKIRFDLIKLQSHQEVPIALGGISFSLKQIKYLPSSFQQTLLNKLDKMVQLSQILSQVQSPGPILGVLTQIWEMMSPEERVQDFKTTQPELYDAFKDLTGPELQWLRVNACDWSIKHPLLGVIGSQICSKISNAGVSKVRDQMLGSIADSVLRQFGNSLKEISQSFGKLLVENISSTLAEEAADFAKNHPSILRQKAYALIEKDILPAGQQLAAMPPSQMTLVAQQKKGFQVLGQVAEPLRNIGGESSGRWISARLAVSRYLVDRQIWSPSHPVYKQTIFSALNTMVDWVGFRDLSGGRRQPLLRPLTGGTAELEFRKNENSTIYYSLPDLLTLQTDHLLAPKQPISARSVSPSSHAELLRGISEWMLFTRDWVPSPFDQSLGKVEFDGQPAIPKPDVYALGLGIASILLKDLEKAGLFVLSSQSEACLVAQCSPQHQSVAAAPTSVSTSSGSASVASAKGAAQLILAIESFLHATEGVEKTQASQLLQVVPGEKSAVQELLESREKLSTLSFALANFLSGFLTQPTGEIASFFDLNSKSVLPSDWSLSDQVQVIRAWLSIYERLKAKAFLWAALDGFHNLISKNSTYEWAQAPAVLLIAEDLSRLAPDAYRSQPQTVAKQARDYLSLGLKDLKSQAIY